MKAALTSILTPVVSSRSLATFASLLAMASIGVAQTILVDFSENAGTASPNWNLSNTAGFNLTNMVDSSGDPTAIDLVYTGAGPEESGVWGVTGAPSPFNQSAAYNDGLFKGTGLTTTFELRDLSPTATYTITLFGSRDSTQVRITNYTVTGLGTGTSQALQTSGSGAGPSVNHNTDDVVVFSNIVPNAGNIISVSFTASQGDFAYLNGMEIAVIPEPTSAVLMLVGGLGFCCIRRLQRSNH